MITIEKHLAAMREAGIDVEEAEANLKPCKCGKPQVIADIIFVGGRVTIYAMCTETDRSRCRVSKRLRMYRDGPLRTKGKRRKKETVRPYEPPTVDTNDPVAVAEQVDAQKMAEAMMGALKDGVPVEDAAGVARAKLAEEEEEFTAESALSDIETGLRAGVADAKVKDEWGEDDGDW